MCKQRRGWTSTDQACWTMYRWPRQNNLMHKKWLTKVFHLKIKEKKKLLASKSLKTEFKKIKHCWDVYVWENNKHRLRKQHESSQNSFYTNRTLWKYGMVGRLFGTWSTSHLPLSPQAALVSRSFSKRLFYWQTLATGIKISHSVYKNKKNKLLKRMQQSSTSPLSLKYLQWTCNGITLIPSKGEKKSPVVEPCSHSSFFIVHQSI